ncbi:unnamed protein product, partial [Lampetra fluviatilis]
MPGDAGDSPESGLEPEPGCNAQQPPVYNEEQIHKTILVGDSSVGKTSLLVQFDQGKFIPGSFTATVGISFTVSPHSARRRTGTSCMSRKKARGEVVWGPRGAAGSPLVSSPGPKPLLANGVSAALTRSSLSSSGEFCDLASK